MRGCGLGWSPRKELGGMLKGYDVHVDVGRLETILRRQQATAKA